MSGSLFLPWIQVHLNHFSRLHIYAFIYDTFLSASDLLPSVGQTLGPSCVAQSENEKQEEGQSTKQNV